MTTKKPPQEIPMQLQCPKPVHASVQQLRDAIRRATATQVVCDDRNERAFLDGVEVKDSSWGEWEDTVFDVRRAAM